MSDQQRARQLWEYGTRLLLEGKADKAVELFTQSIAVYPTAEGYTYRGWALSYLGKYDEAIAECHKAIDVDPDFGNPYNDIGVYLMQQGQMEDAIPWLQKAKLASRYEPRHFPYSNLGTIYERLGHVRQAIAEFKEALKIEPHHEPAKRALARLQANLN